MPTINFDLLKHWFEQLADLSEADRLTFLREAQDIDEDTRYQLLQLLSADAQLADHTARSAIRAPRVDFSDNAMLGQRIGAYVIDKSLGRGGMGSVFLAHRADGSMEQRVAIKIVRPELLDAHTLARFHLERQVLALLNHPHIATLLDAGALSDGSPYVVMEYIEGEAITTYVNAQSLNVRSRLQLFLKVCDAVAFAHRNLIVHRDIKPGNVLVSEDGQPKLLDFGIAKPLIGAIGAIDVQDTAAAQRFFSPHNAAPEQLRNEPITPACDVYGLGVLLYELLTGSKPLDLQGRTPGEMERKVLNEDPKPPSQSVSPIAVVGAASGRESPIGAKVASERDPSPSITEHSLPEAAPSTASTTTLIARRALKGDLDAITLKCLRKNPNDRYASVDKLADDIRAHLDGYAVAARRGGAGYRLRRFVGRHRIAVCASAAILIVATLGALTWLRQYRATLDQQSRADQMTSLIMDAIEAADPGRGSNNELTVRELFDGILQRVVENPEFRHVRNAGMLSALSTIQLRLDAPSKALKVIEHIDVTEVADNEKQDFLRAKLASMLAFERYEDARAVTALGLHYADDPENRARWQMTETLLDFRQGDVDKALAALEVMDLRGLSAERGIEHRRQLARVYIAKGLYDKARNELSALLQEFERRPPRVPGAYEWTYELLKDLAVREENWDEAELQADRMVELSVRLYSRGSYGHGLALAAKAGVLEGRGEIERALALYLKALPMYIRSNGEDFLEVAKLNFLIGRLQRKAGRLDQSEAHLRDAVRIAGRVWPPSNTRHLLFRLMLACQLVELGKFEEARTVAQVAKRDAAPYPELVADEYYVMAHLIEAMASFEQEGTAARRQAVLDRFQPALDAAIGPTAKDAMKRLRLVLSKQGIEVR